MEYSGIHHGISCNGCGANPISGVRFKCQECYEFDVCERCFARCIHREHRMERITASKAGRKILHLI